MTPYGCHNRKTKEGYWASAMAYTDNRRRRIQAAVWIIDRSTPDCQYRKGTPDDPRCVGCEVP